jgi:hypothetical protein
MASRRVAFAGACCGFTRQPKAAFGSPRSSAGAFAAQSEGAWE